MLESLPCMSVRELHPHTKEPIGKQKIIKGFECRGVVFIKSENGDAWIEFHSDNDNFKEGGNFFKAEGQNEKVMFNYLPGGQKQRLSLDKTLKFGAVNKHRVRINSSTAVTGYTYEGGALCKEMRMEGVIRSAIMIPAILGPNEPLNAWIETHDIVEYH